MRKYFYIFRSFMHYKFKSLLNVMHYIMHPSSIKPDLALRHAVSEARRLHEKFGVRYIVVPSPNGMLRVLSVAQARNLIKDGVFPLKWKVSDLYKIAFFWTAATRNPKHGHSLESFNNMHMYHSWWQSSHL